MYVNGMIRLYVPKDPLDFLKVELAQYMFHVLTWMAGRENVAGV